MLPKKELHFGALGSQEGPAAWPRPDDPESRTAQQPSWRFRLPLETAERGSPEPGSFRQA